MSDTINIPMILTCPACGERHIDEGEFATKIHHTHACQGCGMVWRPAIVATVGVRFLPGFKNVAVEPPPALAHAEKPESPIVCQVSPLSSRCCKHGTRGCIALHPPVPAPADTPNEEQRRMLAILEAAPAEKAHEHECEKRHYVVGDPPGGPIHGNFCVCACGWSQYGAPGSPWIAPPTVAEMFPLLPPTHASDERTLGEVVYRMLDDAGYYVEDRFAGHIAAAVVAAHEARRPQPAPGIEERVREAIAKLETADTLLMEAGMGRRIGAQDLVTDALRILRGEGGGK